MHHVALPTRCILTGQCDPKIAQIINFYNADKQTSTYAAIHTSVLVLKSGHCCINYKLGMSLLQLQVQLKYDFSKTRVILILIHYKRPKQFSQLAFTCHQYMSWRWCTLHCMASFMLTSIISKTLSGDAFSNRFPANTIFEFSTSPVINLAFLQRIISIYQRIAGSWHTA